MGHGAEHFVVSDNACTASHYQVIDTYQLCDCILIFIANLITCACGSKLYCYYTAMWWQTSISISLYINLYNPIRFHVSLHKNKWCHYGMSHRNTKLISDEQDWTSQPNSRKGLKTRVLVLEATMATLIYTRSLSLQLKT